MNLKEFADTAWSRMLQTAKAMGYKPYYSKNRVQKDLEKQDGTPPDMITLDKIRQYDDEHEEK